MMCNFGIKIKLYRVRGVAVWCNIRHTFIKICNELGNNMAKLRLFVSSTCYDLGMLRSELRPFILNLGYEPVMSEYSDVLFDPRTHSHKSCVNEVSSCDMVILIVGSRFGGTALPSASDDLDFSILENLSNKTDVLKYKDKLSITQIEILQAIHKNIPIYVFVDDKVLYEHHVYEKNKENSAIIDLIEFPSIQNKSSAKYIFEFINYLTHRVTNNAIHPFSKLEDIRIHLLSQWSQLFQRLIYEDRSRDKDATKYRDFSERLEDLKTVILTSISTPDLKIIAKGAIQFRRLVNFVASLKNINSDHVLRSSMTWSELLSLAKIVDTLPIDVSGHPSNSRCYIVLEDRTFYITRFTARGFVNIERDWNEFTQISNDARQAIVGALLEDQSVYIPILRYFNENFDDYLIEQANPKIVNSAHQIVFDE